MLFRVRCVKYVVEVFCPQLPVSKGLKTLLDLFLSHHVVALTFTMLW